MCVCACVHWSVLPNGEETVAQAMWGNEPCCGCILASQPFPVRMDYEPSVLCSQDWGPHDGAQKHTLGGCALHKANWPGVLGKLRQPWHWVHGSFMLHLMWNSVLLINRRYMLHVGKNTRFLIKLSDERWPDKTRVHLFSLNFSFNLDI